MIHHEYTPHPILNMCITISLAALGTGLGSVTGMAIPTIVMQLFQILAWVSAFVIAMVSVYKTVKAKKESKVEDKEVD
jgi:purine-cytosine permease-like protein